MSDIEEIMNGIDEVIEELESDKADLEKAKVIIGLAENFAEMCRLQIEYNEIRECGEVEKMDFFEGDKWKPDEKQLEELKSKLNQAQAALFFQQEGMSPRMVAHKRKLSKKVPRSDKIHHTFDVYFVPYQMAKELCIWELTDEDLPANQQLSKDVAKRLALSVEEVTVRTFYDDDDGVYIQLKIRGSEQDIEKVNEVLQARYDSVEQEDEETPES